MLNVSSGQLTTFILSILMGFGVGVITVFLYSILSLCKNKIVKHIFECVLDFLSPIVFVAIIFVSSLIFNYGITRWFIIVAVMIGYFIAYKIGECIKSIIIKVTIKRKLSNK